MQATILCAERHIGPLTLGHLVSTLRQRLFFQDRHNQYLLLDGETDEQVLDLAADHLAVGIDPTRVTLLNRRAVPELATLQRALQPIAPTPASPTATLLAGLQPQLVSAHAASATTLADANHLIRAVNARAGRSLLAEAQALLPTRSPFAAPRTALDIPFTADADAIAAVIAALPSATQVGLPARETDGHPLFQLLTVFEHDLPFVDDLKAKFRRGGLSERVVKAHLIDCAERVLAPVRESRAALAANRATLQAVLDAGNARARDTVGAVLADVRRVLA
ncbi:hypothetical protein [Chitinolyticbacter meiyuanensis]|uniref:hypothetical protein n=1 Tax=Chitinolyticbacter meiyuanensis TaxID=682798 RepID=UPI0011E58EE6|nr:hypothetical protein [Chitinolyticbacter meiyuanensis]